MSSGDSLLEPNKAWLSQGDLFRQVIVAEAGVVGAQAQAVTNRGPALLVTPDCEIDKKRREKGRKVSRLEYLAFLPVHDVMTLGEERAGDLRRRAAASDLTPYAALYLGEFAPELEGYVALSRPYHLPALLLRTELQEFTNDETGGEGDDTRVVPTIGDTRVGMLNSATMSLFRDKWMAFWLGIKPSLPSPE